MTNEQKIDMLTNLKNSNGAFTGYTSGFYELMDELIELLKHGACPYYETDDDGHGICKNHRYIDDEFCGYTDEERAFMDKVLLKNSSDTGVNVFDAKLSSVIPQNATNGDAFTYLFGDIDASEITKQIKFAGATLNIFDKEWWYAPYKGVCNESEMTDEQNKDLQEVLKQITRKYEEALNNTYVYKPMAYTLYHIWQKWDRKELIRLERGDK